MSGDLLEAGVVASADAVARGDVTAEALASAALARLETRGRRFNGIARIDADRALEQARAVDLARIRGEPLGPLGGVPMAHKDLFYRAGHEAACGSKIRRGFVPDVTAAVLSRLDGAGAVDCGTLHMAEFAMSPTGFNAHFGHGMNPWNAAHACGGSSSGSGIAVGADCVPASLGSDTGGSIRMPAAMCGVTGLKPTNGAVSLRGAMPLSATLDCIGPLARRASDVARLHDVIARPAPAGGAEAGLSDGVRGLTLALPQGFYRDQLDDDVTQALAEAERSFAALGMDLRPTSAPDMTRLNAVAQLVMSVEAATIHRKWLQTRPDDYGDQVRARIEPGLFHPATRYVEALSLRGPLRADWIECALGGADCALLPAVPMTVPTIADSSGGSPDEIAAMLGAVSRNTRALNYLGLPALALPCGFSRDGLPIGMQLVARPWAEGLLLRVGHAFQQITNWHLRRPSGLDKAV